MKFRRRYTNKYILAFFGAVDFFIYAFVVLFSPFAMLVVFFNLINKIMGFL